MLDRLSNYYEKKLGIPDYSLYEYYDQMVEMPPPLKITDESGEKLFNDWLMDCAKEISTTKFKKIIEQYMSKEAEKLVMKQFKGIKENLKSVEHFEEKLSKWDMKIDFLDFCMEEVKLISDSGGTSPEEQLQREFFTNIVPRTDKYYGFLLIKGKLCTSVFLNYYDFKDCFLAAQFYKYANVIFYPCSFNRKRAFDEYSNLVQCVRIDIDDFDDAVMDDFENGCKDVPFYCWEANKLRLFVSEALNLQGYPEPTYIVASGRGLHLYWALSEPIEKGTDNYDVYIRYWEAINTFVGGDIALRNISHGIRVPQTYNCKKSPICKTKLVRGNGSIYNLDKLRDFEKLYSLDKSETYKNGKQKESREKANDTHEINITAEMKRADCLTERLNKEILEHISRDYLLKITANASKTSKKATAKKGKTEKIPASSISNICSDMMPATDFNPRARLRNFLKDMHNYYIQENEKGSFVGKRNLYFFILSNSLRNIMNKEKCIEYCEKYVNDDFYDELLEVIEKVYSRDFTYKYTYSKIAETLGFDDYFIEHAHCNFSKERIEQAKRRNQIKSNQKRRTPGSTQSRKKEVCDYILKHPETACRKIAWKMNVSFKTVARYKIELGLNSPKQCVPKKGKCDCSDDLSDSLYDYEDYDEYEPDKDDDDTPHYKFIDEIKYANESDEPDEDGFFWDYSEPEYD